MRVAEGSPVILHSESPPVRELPLGHTDRSHRLITKVIVDLLNIDRCEQSPSQFAMLSDQTAFLTYPPICDVLVVLFLVLLIVLDSLTCRVVVEFVVTFVVLYA